MRYTSHIAIALTLALTTASFAQKPAAAPAPPQADAAALIAEQTRYEANNLVNAALVDTRDKAALKSELLKDYLKSTGQGAAYLEGRKPRGEARMNYDKAMVLANEQIARDMPNLVPMTNDLQMLKASADAAESLARKQAGETVKMVEDSADMEAFVRERGQWEAFLEFARAERSPEALAAEQAARDAKVANIQAKKDANEAREAQKRQQNIAKYQQNMQNASAVKNYKEEYYYKNSSFSRDFDNYYGSW